MTAMDIGEVMKYLPHRYPMLLIDRVLECQPGRVLRALKNVTADEPFFQGHFPVRPVMPGVFILETMAQATGIFGLRTLDQLPGAASVYYFVGVDDARFRRPVEPGDQMIIEVTPIRQARAVWRVKCEATVDGEVVASYNIMGALRETEP